jgi:hypothetical protein
MRDDSLISWEDEERWDYSHQLLSLETIVPLFEFIGIPFQGDSAEPFHGMLKKYVWQLYIADSNRGLSLETKRDLLLREIDNAYNAHWRNEYVNWLLGVFVYKVGDHMAGWSQWRTIFMRCSVRHGWWQRLNLPAKKDPLVRRELESAKTRMDDVRELVQTQKNRSLSEWDKRVMELLRIDDDAKESGEPFSRILLTSGFFLFYLFWIGMTKILDHEELHKLWEAGKSIAPDVGIDTNDLPDPNSMRLASS